MNTQREKTHTQNRVKCDHDIRVVEKRFYWYIEKEQAFELQCTQGIISYASAADVDLNSHCTEEVGVASTISLFGTFVNTSKNASPA